MLTKHINLEVKLFAFLCGLVLLFFWPLPNTMSIRNLALLGGALSCFWIWLDKRKVWGAHLTIITHLLPAIFFFWLFVHYILFKTSREEQLYDLYNVWIRCACAVLTGYAFGYFLLSAEAKSYNYKIVIRWAYLISISGTALIFFARYIDSALSGHQPHELSLFLSLYEGKTAIIVFANLSIASILVMANSNEKISPYIFFNCLLLALAAICMFGLFYSNTKNGLVISLIIIIASKGLMLKIHKKVKLALGGKIELLLIVVLVSLSCWLLTLHIKNSPEWLTVIADIKEGTDIEGNMYWKDSNNYAAPINELGKPVNHSAYARTAWFVAGLQLLVKHPMGYGVLQHSFGALAAAEWTDFREPDGRTRGSTHSGWLDLALGVGLPGFFIIVSWMVSCWFRCLKQTDFWSSVAKITIPTMLITYLVAEVCVDHFIELLFFMIAFLTLMTQKKRLE